MRLILNLNAQCQSVLSLAAGAYTGYQTNSHNNVFPCFVSPTGTGQGSVLSSATALTVSLGIAKSYNTTATYTHPIGSSRFYARVCEMTPQCKKTYLSAVPTKRTLYYGSIPLGMSSCLLSQNDWENDYRFCYIDLSRRISQPNNYIIRSIQVIFPNASSYLPDYYYIIGYKEGNPDFYFYCVSCHIIKLFI